VNAVAFTDETSNILYSGTDDGMCKEIRHTDRHTQTDRQTDRETDRETSNIL